MGPGPREGAVEEETVPAPWEAPSLATRSVWTESELQRLGREYTDWCSGYGGSRQKTEISRGLVLSCCSTRPKMHTCLYTQGLGDETWGSGRAQGEHRLATQRQPEGAKV